MIGNLFKAWLASVVIRKVFPWLAVIALAVVALVWWVIWPGRNFLFFVIPTPRGTSLSN